MEQANNKKIAIIIPAYNIENYIGECLESLVKQTYSNLEIIVVNDGSKDNTLSIIQSYADKDNRIKVISQENQGLSEARNVAMKEIKAEYTMFVDGDDWLALDTCETVMKEFKKEQPDIVWFAYIREYEKKSMPKGAFEEERIIFNKKEVKEKLQRRIYGPYEKEELAHPEKLDALSPVWGKVYRTKILEGHVFRSFKEIGATCEDVFFNPEILEEVKKVVYIRKNFYHYRKFNPTSVTKSVDKNLFEKWKKAYSLLNKIIAEKKYDNSYKVALKNRFAINLIAIGMRICNGKDDFNTKYKMLKDILHDEVYKEAVQALDISSMPLHWKIFFWNAKKQLTVFVYLLLVIMSTLASRK